MKDALSKIFGFIGKVLAVLLVFALLINSLNDIWHFMPEIWSTVWMYISTYGLFALASIIAFSAAVKGHPIIAIIMLIIIVVTFGFTFASHIILQFFKS